MEHIKAKYVPNDNRGSMLSAITENDIEQSIRLPGAAELEEEKKMK